MADFPIDIRIQQPNLTPVNRGLDEMDTRAQRASGSVRALGAGLAAIGAGAIARNTLRTIASFSQEMSTVQAISGATTRELAALRTEITELGSSTRFSASQAAQGAQFLARAGFDTDQILGSLNATLTLAQAGALDLASAADIASNVLQGFRLSADESGRAVDVLAFAANRSNTDVRQLGDAMSYVAPIASGLGVELETTAAAIGALSDAGIQGSTAGTGLRRVLSVLESPTEAVRKRLEALGVTTDEVRVSQVGLTEALSRLRQAGITTGDALEIFGDRGGPAFEVLASSIPRVIELNAQLEQSAGFAQGVADIMDDNLNGALLSVNSALEGLVIRFGELGSETSATQAASGLAGAIRGLTENLETVVSVGTVAVSVLGARMVQALGAAAAAKVADIRATAAQATAQVELLTTERQLAISAQNRAVQDQAAAARALNLARTDFARTRAVTQLAAANQTLIASNNAATAATNALTAAQVNFNRVATVAGTAVRGLSAGLALVGGPLGAAVLAATAIYTFGRRNAESLSEVESHTERVARLRQELGLLADAQEQSAEQELRNIRETTRARNVEIRERLAGLQEAERRTQEALQDPERARREGTILRRNLQGQRQAQERLRAELEESRQAFRDAGSALSAYNKQVKDVEEANKGLSDSQGIVSDAFKTVTESIEDEIYKLREQAGLLDANAASYDLLVAAREAGVELGTREAAELERLLTLRNELTETVRRQEQVERERAQADSTVEQLTRQREALRLTGEEQAVFNATAGLSSAVTDEQREAIERLTREIYAQNEALRAQRELKDFDREALSEVDRLNAEADEVREANRVALEQGLQDQQEFADRELEINRKLAADKLRLRQQSESAVRQAAAQGLDALAGIIEAGAGKQNAAYRAVFAASRAFALADSIAKVAQAQAQALADPTAVTLPQKLANYTAVATAGAGLLQSLRQPQGFKDGGYTGSMGVNDIAGVVHGQEFVMPAGPTRAYRNELEAMRRGQSPSGGRGGVTIINNVSDRVAVTTEESDDGELIARIDERINERTPAVMAGEASDPYSDYTRAMESRYRLERN